MLFNSFEFLLFLPLVFLLYWFVFTSLRKQNYLVVIASYVFYGWWDWRFLLLIAFTTFCSFWSGRLIEAWEGNRRKQKWVSVANIVLNVGILGLFKYFNFFSESLVLLVNGWGYSLDWVTLELVLPVGISFYTFQALSYSIDVYQGKIRACRDSVSFFAYVSFFPQLVAGPIERATSLLPQFERSREFDGSKAREGFLQILWGFLKKVVLADNCAEYVNVVFQSYADESGSTLFLAAVLFSLQIYGDFSGYSDIAIGTAKLFGIQLMQNFNVPYFSRDIAEFWRRWHISLTTWFRDYIYIPLGGSRVSKGKVIRNIFIIFMISGLWHGANFTFVAWGVYHATLFLPLFLFGTHRKYTDVVAKGRCLPNMREFVQMLTTFLLVVVGWILFRADSLTMVVEYIQHMLDESLFTIPKLKETGLGPQFYSMALSALLVFGVEWLRREDQRFMLPIRSKSVRWLVYMFLLAIILLYMNTEESNFIYFQF